MPKIQSKPKKDAQMRGIGAALEVLGQNTVHWADQKRQLEFANQKAVAAQMKDQAAADALSEGAKLVLGMRSQAQKPLYSGGLHQQSAPEVPKDVQQQEIMGVVHQISKNAPNQLQPFLKSIAEAQDAIDRQAAMPKVQERIMSGVAMGAFDEQVAQTFAQFIADGKDPSEVMAMVDSAIGDYAKAQATEFNQTQKAQAFHELMTVDLPSGYVNRTDWLHDIYTLTKDMPLEQQVRTMRLAAHPDGGHMVEELTNQKKEMEKLRTQAAQANWNHRVSQALLKAANGDEQEAAAELDALGVPADAWDSFRQAYPKALRGDASKPAAQATTFQGSRAWADVPMEEKKPALDGIRRLLDQYQSALSAHPDQGPQIAAMYDKQIQSVIDGLGVSATLEQIKAEVQNYKAPHTRPQKGQVWGGYGQPAGGWENQPPRKP
jgi:hypothetical protein